MRILNKDSYLNCIDEAQPEDKAKHLAYIARIQQQLIQEENGKIFMQRLYNQFRVIENSYYFKDASGVVFTDQGSRIATPSGDDRVSQAMLTMVQAKGWKFIKVSGHPDFKRQIWMEASELGIEVYGYAPTEQELDQLNKSRNHTGVNVIKETASLTNKNDQSIKRDPLATTTLDSSQNNEQTTGPIYTGRLLEYGHAHYNHNKDEPIDFYVKLATDKGEDTVWGSDLKAALYQESANVGDYVTLKVLRSMKDIVEEETGLSTQWTDKIVSVWKVSILEKAKAAETVKAVAPVKLKKVKTVETVKTVASAKLKKTKAVETVEAIAPDKSKKVNATADRIYTGRILDHGQDYYQHNKDEKSSYYIKLATNEGEITVWGTDLERAISEKKANKNDYISLKFIGSEPVKVEIPIRDQRGKIVGNQWIDTQRNTWEISKSNETKVIDAVTSSFLNSHIKNPELREILGKALETHLLERQAANQIPTVSIYDKNAPTKEPAQERTELRIVSNRERAR